MTTNLEKNKDTCNETDVCMEKIISNMEKIVSDMEKFNSDMKKIIADQNKVKNNIQDSVLAESNEPTVDVEKVSSVWDKNSKVDDDLKRSFYEFKKRQKKE